MTASAEIAPAELAALLRDTAAHHPLLVDVRGPDETLHGLLPGARRLATAELAAALAPERTRSVVVYCARGQRSAAAAATLRAAGFDARSLTGGIAAWQAAGLALGPGDSDGAAGFSPAELERYSRQLRLPEIGLAGQARLKGARVACVGLGGLGSPAALYLAGAGVGTLTLIDPDRVALSNLHRQVLHATARLGTPKTDSAVASLAALNPDIVLRPQSVRLANHNAAELLARHDVVVDGSDNFATRYLVNDAALALGIPVVHAAIQGLEGQLATFRGDGRPCYRCLFPAPPPADAAPSCDELGVLGVLPGVLGLLQATEALKLVLGIGTPLAGRLLLFDALALRFTELAVEPRADCRCAGLSGAR